MKHSDHFVRLLRNGEQAPILGISLGFRSVSEHQRGYIDFEGDQLDPRGLRLYEFADAVYLIYWPGAFVPDKFGPNPPELEEKELCLKSGLYRSFSSNWMNSEPNLACAWAPYGFIIGTNRNDPQIAEFLKELYRAFCGGDGRAYLHEIQLFKLHRALCVYAQPIEGEIIGNGLIGRRALLPNR